MPTSLDELRDIHLPEEIKWWPLAYGYWLLLALLLVAAALWFRRYRQLAIRRASTVELRKLVAIYKQHNDAHELARGVNVLLRRTALSLKPREQTASLTGDAWMDYVQECVAGSGFEFSEETRQLLTHGVYQQHVDVNASRLLEECRSWVRAVPPVVNS
ncbi:MAG: DUF4381 domain-containing protein [Gammaproteobacteria bacterium]